MANRNSDLITNSIASPIVKNQVTVSDGQPRVEFPTVTLAAAQLATNDVLRLVRLPSNAIIRNVEIYNVADLDSAAAAAFKLGVNKTDGTVGDDDVYGAGQQALQAPNAVWTSIFKPAMADLGKQLWAAAGLTSDPGGHLDLVMTMTNSATGDGAAGAFTVRVEWSHS